MAKGYWISLYTKIENQEKRDWLGYWNRHYDCRIFVPCKQLWIRNVQTIESQIKHVFYIT